MKKVLIIGISGQDLYLSQHLLSKKNIRFTE